jgi:plasmid stabilization system protein ParE
MRVASGLAALDIKEAIEGRREECGRLSAQAFLNDIRSTVDRLRRFPDSGSARPDLTSLPVRFCLVQTHWLVYTPEPFHVVRFLYAGRDIMALLG